MHKKTLAELAAGLSAGEFSSEELTRHYLDRIERFDPQLNSFITVTADAAVAAAQAADQQRAAGQAGPLTGIPIAHKDIFCTEGVRTSAGSQMLDQFISPYDATVVERLKIAGTVMLGKANMDEFAMGSSNENSSYGAVKNPWNLDTIPGGSSGGSAAAVAAGLAPCATGTDTGGSIRQPASFCGVTGIKPTYGRVSRFGMIAYASSLDQGGIFARTAEDSALLLNTIAGFDPRDSTSVEQAVPDYTTTLNDSIAGLKVGVPKEWLGDGVDADVAERVDQALKAYQALGAEIIEITLPNSSLSVAAYYVIAMSEASSNLSRFDGVRYGYRCEEATDLLDLYMRSRSEGFGEEVKRRIMIGTYALSAGYYDAYYLKAQKLRRMIADDFRHAFEQVDVIMGPVAPTAAFKLGEKSDDPVKMYLGDIFTLPLNLAGLPGLSLPVGKTPSGLPVGLQIIGNYWQEGRLLNIAHRYQQEHGMNREWPEGF